MGHGSGARVVFDDEGLPKDPLELLATSSSGLGRRRRGTADGDDEDGSGGSGGDGDGGADGEGVYVVSEVAQDRYRRAADLMRKRDRDDRQRIKQLRKVMEAW